MKRKKTPAKTWSHQNFKYALVEVKVKSLYMYIFCRRQKILPSFSHQNKFFSDNCERQRGPSHVVFSPEVTIGHKTKYHTSNKVIALFHTHLRKYFFWWLWGKSSVSSRLCKIGSQHVYHALSEPFFCHYRQVSIHLLEKKHVWRTTEKWQ